MVIRDEQDIYNILTNRKKLDTYWKNMKKKNNHLDNEEDVQQICCDEITPVLEKKMKYRNRNNNTNNVTNLLFSFKHK